MGTTRTIAAIAGLVVVLTGSVTFWQCTLSGSYELATMSAGFAAVGLYLLFGKEPPRTP